MSGTPPVVRHAPANLLSSRAVGDRLVYLGFFTLPFLAYFAAALAGHPVIPGDDLIQNEPLRVLSGEVIRAGHLPSWNPLIWSGTPLLAGWNAGALFPGTFLFAFLPAIPAWTINYALAPALCAVGMHWFLRRLGLKTLPAACGALVFTYTGFMSGQVVHIGLVQGTAFTPFVLIGIDGIARSATFRRRAGWSALLALSSGLLVLAGDPRAISSAAIIALVYLGFVLVERRHSITSWILPLLLGAAGGLALSGVQWLPGIGFLHASQRASAAYSLFGQGSFTFATLMQNLLVPFLIGGNGNLGQGTYTGAENQPEVTIGAGLVALVVVFAYLPELSGRLRRLLRGSSAAIETPPRPLVVFYVLGALGVLLALGDSTPFAHLLVHIPLFGGERLQNRNAVLIDFALAALVARFLDDLGGVALRPGQTDTAPHHSPFERRAGRLLGLMPCAAVIALIAYALARPLSLEHHLGVLGLRPALFEGSLPYLAVTIGFATVVALFVVGGRWLPRRLSFGIATALVVCDVLLYALNAPYGSVAPSALSPGRLSAALSSNLDQRANLDRHGRFALFDPAELVPGSDRYVVDRLGVTDLNVIAGNPSVQGYGSIVNGDYQAGTGTHALEDIDPATLNGPTFDALGLTSLLTMTVYFDEELPLGDPVPVTLASGVVRHGPTIPDAPPFAGGPWTLAHDTPAFFLIPSPVVVANVTIIFDGPTSGLGEVSVRAGEQGGAFVTNAGRVRAGQVTIAFPSTTTATDFTVSDPSQRAATIGAFLVTTRGPTQRFLLDGALQDVLRPPHWLESHSLGPFLRFTDTRVPGIAWLEPIGVRNALSTPRARGTVRITSDSLTSPETLDVDLPRSATLVRSEGYAPGWTAEARPLDGGTPLQLVVRRLGLIQQIALPKGDFVVSFRYAPASETVGLWLTAFGAVLLLGLIGIAAVPRRRRRT